MGSAPHYAAAVIQALILNRHFCPYEERKLRERFGDAYNAYASRVRRWI
jgi:protein-S-isoprenylcysteine O-methyltransferase Ste14